MSTFEPSFSTSMSRHSMAATAAPSSAPDPLPNVNFGYDELRDRMAKFSMRFDGFIEQGRKRVLGERNQFRMNLAELQEDQRMRAKDIEIFQLKTASHQQTVEKESSEARKMQSDIATLGQQRDEHHKRRDELQKQIAATQKAIEACETAQRAHARRRAAQARFNLPELDFWTSTLCLTIEGAGRDDRLKFVFSHVDERDWDREAWFEIMTTSRDYDVGRTRPKLERERVDKMLEKVNETRELVGLLKGMRELFVEVMRAGGDQ